MAGAAGCLALPDAVPDGRVAAFGDPAYPVLTRENADSVGTFSERAFKKDYFVRWAVTKGLDYQSKLGANPFQYGFTGGTDNHNGLPSDVAENDYIGSHGPADGTLQARRAGEIDGWIKSQESNPGSIAGVWAAKNTRGMNKVYAALMSAEPDNLQVKNNFATTSFLLRQGLPAAHEIAREIYKQHPESPIICSTYAYSLHLQGRNREAAFYDGKVQSARFFIKNVLPQVDGMAAAIRNEDFSIMAVHNDSF